MRIAIGGCVQEANSFSPVPGSRMHYTGEQILRGAELLERRRGTRTEFGGILDVAAERDLTLVPLVHSMARAACGPIERGLFDELLGELLDRLRAAGPLDGVLLVLHGAMSAEHHDDATGEVLRAVRAVVGDSVPVIATLDLHANVTEQMVAQATALVGYHTAPHIDLYETGQRAMRLMDKVLRSGAQPVSALRRLPMIVPAENGRTTDGPYAVVMDRAIERAKLPGVLDISVCSVQPWLDVYDAACTTLVVTDGDQALADRLADELAGMFWERRQEFAVQLEPAGELIARALASDKQPWVLADSADAPSSGAPGDSTAVLKLLMEAKPERPCLLNLVDPQAVSAMAAAGPGAELTLTFGAYYGSTLYQPVEVSGRVRLVSNGMFVNKGLGFQGVAFDRGQTVVFDIGQIALVVMERPVIQWDPELYRSLGLEPAEAQIVVVKSPAAFRAAYGPFAAAIEILNVPGVCSPNLPALPFTKVRRPIYPLDQLQDWRW